MPLHINVASLCTAFVPCLTYAFAVSPCTKAYLIIFDTMIDDVIKHKFKL